MSRQSLEDRVAELEGRVTELQTELRASSQGKAKDWKRTIGAFTGDAGMQEILKEAMRLREADRRKSRPRQLTKRKPRS
jgi:hypothetical protein